MHRFESREYKGCVLFLNIGSLYRDHSLFNLINQSENRIERLLFVLVYVILWVKREM